MGTGTSAPVRLTLRPTEWDSDLVGRPDRGNHRPPRPAVPSCRDRVRVALPHSQR